MWYMPKRWICLFCFAATFASGPAQTRVNTGAILATARQDLTVTLKAEQVDYMRQNSSRLPFVERVALRTESDRFQLQREEYLTRFSVNGLDEMRRQRQLTRMNGEVEQSKQRNYLHEALYERYQNLLDYLQFQRERALQQQLLLVYDDQVLVLGKMAALDAGADLTDLIKAEYDRDEVAMKISAVQGGILQLRQALQPMLSGVSGDWELDTTGVIQPQDLERIVATLSQSVLQNPAIPEKQAKIARIDAEYALEKAEARKMLDFFQLRYQHRPEEALNRELSVGFGINLPYKGSSRIKLDELKIEKHIQDQDLQLYLADLARQVAQAKQQLATLAQRQQLAQKQWQESQARFTLDRASANTPGGPFPLLKARELQLKRQLNLFDIEREMYEQYLKILDWTGALSDGPLVNYLMTGLPVF